MTVFTPTTILVFVVMTMLVLVVTTMLVVVLVTALVLVIMPVLVMPRAAQAVLMSRVIRAGAAQGAFVVHIAKDATENK